MILRKISNASAFAIGQEDHADVAAQCAAHWGRAPFAKLEPYHTMVFGTIYHDSGHREMEAGVPIDPSTGLLYNFRGAPPEVRNPESDRLNSLWIRQRDPYAGLVVAVHHTGLRKRRYDTVSMTGGSINRPGRPESEPPLGVDNAFDDLQGWQRETAEELDLIEPAKRRLFWHNYKMLQVFDLLSLYFCCDGYVDGQLAPVTFLDVPLSPDSEEHVNIQAEPVGRDAVRFSPYPFDVNPLELAAQARELAVHMGEPAAIAQEEFYKAPRHTLSWQVAA